MQRGMRQAQEQLTERVEGDPLLRGMYVRVRGEHLILGRPDGDAPGGTSQSDDRLRLTRLSRDQWGLSVKRHTGRWERTPFSGDFDVVVETVHAFMQHLVAPL
jgi:hypothetical protein